jgi:hypothetical protein
MTQPQFWLVVKAAFFLLFAANFVGALITGRVLAANLGRSYFARRDEAPILFWIFTLFDLASMIYVGGLLAADLAPGLSVPWG